MDSVLTWVGGKRLLAKEIIKRIPPHNCYVEPFGGAAWVLFKKERMRSASGDLAVEVYNDINFELYNLFLQVKYHGDELIREISGFMVSRKLFQRLKEFVPLTEIQRAARFFILINFSFGGRGEHYGTQRKSGGGASKDKERFLRRIKAAKKRLKAVLIENLDFEQCIERYDSPHTFFYCDPPYFKGLNYDKYGVVWGEEHHIRLRKILGAIKGKFLLSYDDCPEARCLYDGFTIEQISRQKGINRKTFKGTWLFQELFVRNYPLTRSEHCCS